jgi:hypothetical protein
MKRMALVLGLAAVVSCQRGLDPNNVRSMGDAFVQAYYVEANLSAAQAYCGALACQKLADELSLRAGQPISSETRQPQITARRLREIPTDDEAIRILYEIRVKPPELDAFTREAYLKLRQQGQEWRVIQFAELKTQ